MPKYVNADKLIARFREIADENWNKRAAPVCWSDAYEHFIDELEEAEAEDVAPVVHAHWDFWDYDKYDGRGECIIHHPMVRCSNCKHGFRAKLLWVRSYCPNCGAKMDDEEG